MIAEILNAVQARRITTVAELVFETGLDRWQVEGALDILVRRGSLFREHRTPGDGCSHTPRPRCGQCPLVDRCGSPSSAIEVVFCPQDTHGSRNAGVAVFTLFQYP